MNYIAKQNRQNMTEHCSLQSALPIIYNSPADYNFGPAASALSLGSPPSTVRSGSAGSMAIKDLTSASTSAKA